MTALLIDQVLPHYDFAVTHTAVFHTPPGQCLQAARSLDLLRHPIVRTLITARSLTTPNQRPRSLRIDDMVEPPLNWLREQPVVTEKVPAVLARSVGTALVHEAIVLRGSIDLRSSHRLDRGSSRVPHQGPQQHH